MGSVIGVRSGTEEVPYTVLEADGNFEVRQYGERMVIETLMRDADSLNDSSGFNTLANFIFGKNDERETIAMTSPVEVRPNEGPGKGIEQALLKAGNGMFMRFTLPRALKEGEIPRPVDPRVTVSRVGPQKFAAVRFTGAWSESAFSEQGKNLLKKVEQSQYRAIGPIVSMRYDPPWTIACFRRNEVAVEVEPVKSLSVT